MKKSINKLKGVTLIELMVVIAVMTTILGISVVFIRQYQSNVRLFTCSRELKSNINKARERTISEQKIYGIRFFEPENRYEFILAESPDNPLESYLLDEQILFSQISPFTDNILKFNKAGAVNESGIIILENIKQDQKTITINPSGYVYAE
ncbi:prepilin-type N-terminal cleavage/methylation domain-containing protein [Patescibacteria group bacterium]|nr:prepilin-type N-terminal cleavage/methylation domain-containing protein [Patescibacteria group bacterium]